LVGGAIGKYAIESRTSIREIGKPKAEVVPRKMYGNERAARYSSVADVSRKYEVRRKALIGKDVVKKEFVIDRAIGDTKVAKSREGKLSRDYQFITKSYANKRRPVRTGGEMGVVTEVKRGKSSITEGLYSTKTEAGTTTSSLRRVNKGVYKGELIKNVAGGKTERMKLTVRPYREITRSETPSFFRSRRGQLQLTSPETVTKPGRVTGGDLDIMGTSSAGLVSSVSKTAPRTGGRVFSAFPIASELETTRPLQGSKGKLKVFTKTDTSSVIRTAEREDLKVVTTPRSSSRSSTAQQSQSFLVSPPSFGGGGSPRSPESRFRSPTVPGITPPPFLKPEFGLKKRRPVQSLKFKKVSRYTPTLSGVLGFRGIKPTARAVTGFETREPLKRRRGKRKRGRQRSFLGLI